MLGQPLRPLSFPGEAPVEASLLGGTARDFNLMVDRSVGGAALRVERTFSMEVNLAVGELLLMHVLAGRVHHGNTLLQTHETLLLEGVDHTTLQAQGALAIVVRAWLHAWAIAGLRGCATGIRGALKGFKEPSRADVGNALGVGDLSSRPSSRRRRSREDETRKRLSDGASNGRSGVRLARRRQPGAAEAG